MIHLPELREHQVLSDLDISEETNSRIDQYAIELVNYVLRAGSGQQVRSTLAHTSNCLRRPGLHCPVHLGVGMIRSHP